MKLKYQDKDVLKSIIDTLLNKMGNGFIFFANVNEDRVQFLARSNINLSAGDIIKLAASKSNGNGGGSPTFAQGGGKDITHLDEILDEIRNQF